MSERSIIQLPREDFYQKDTILRRKSEPVAVFGGDLRSLIIDLIDTLNKHRIAVGLSAPQIGVLSRATVINTKKRENGEPLVMINPRFVSKSAEIETKMEACMSLP